MGRIICELERIYGVRQGSNNPKGTNIGHPTMLGDVSQSDIANKLNGFNGTNLTKEKLSLNNVQSRKKI